MEDRGETRYYAGDQRCGASEIRTHDAGMMMAVAPAAWERYDDALRLNRHRCYYRWLSMPAQEFCKSTLEAPGAKQGKVRLSILATRVSSGLHVFEAFSKQCRRLVANAWMSPLAIVKNLDVFLDRRLSMSARHVMLVMRQFVSCLRRPLRSSPTAKPYASSSGCMRRTP